MVHCTDFEKFLKFLVDILGREFCYNFNNFGVFFPPGDDRKSWPQHVLAFWLCCHQIVPSAQLQVWPHHHLRRRRLRLLLQRSLHSCRHSRDEDENRASSATRRCSRIHKWRIWAWQTVTKCSINCKSWPWSPVTFYSVCGTCQYMD